MRKKANSLMMPIIVSLVLLAIILFIVLRAYGVTFDNVRQKFNNIIDSLFSKKATPTPTTAPTIRYDPVTDTVQYYDNEAWVNVRAEEQVGGKTFDPAVLRKELVNDFYLSDNARKQKRYDFNIGYIQELTKPHTQSYEHFPFLEEVCVRSRAAGSREVVLELTAQKTPCFEKSYGDIIINQNGPEIDFVPLLSIKDNFYFEYGRPEQITNATILQNIRAITTAWQDQIFTTPVKITYDKDKVVYYCAIKDKGRYVAIKNLNQPVAKESVCPA